MIVMRNVENWRWATIQNLEQVFLDFRGRLERRLRDAAETTRRAIQTARDRRQEQADSVTAAIERLNSARRDLDATLSCMAGSPPA